MVKKPMQTLSKNEQDTIALAQALAETVRPGDVMCLHGDLGAGKTVFARALIRSLSGQANLDVPSPTFTLLQTYETGRGTIWHFDLYRVKEAAEIYELGWEEALAGGIVLVEWPERLGPLAPSDRLDVRFHLSEDSEDQDQLDIVVTAHGTLTERFELS